MNKMQHDNEVCANCGLTYEGHISNTGCLHPCWKASGTFKATPPAPQRHDDKGNPMNSKCSFAGNMTIREAFVMAAMQGYIAADAGGNVSHKNIATLAIESADETLRQLGYNA